ncbi:MAG: hypothetical protein JSS30_04865 [Verrucomicrobia bacterium]|nr:hypothetical protein [Verrucomicrobiota bacterium]
MNKQISWPLLLLLLSCQSRPIEEPLAHNQLIASTDDKILVAQIVTPLTKDDVHRLDRHYPKTLQKIYKNRPLTAHDIINMTRAGVSDGVIIEIIGKSQSLFFLTPSDTLELSQAGVSKRVITVMQNTADTRY